MPGVQNLILLRQEYRKVGNRALGVFAGCDHHATGHVHAADERPSTRQLPVGALAMNRAAAGGAARQHGVVAGAGKELLLGFQRKPAQVHHVGKDQRHQPAGRSALAREPLTHREMRSPVKTVASKASRSVQFVQPRLSQRVHHLGDRVAQLLRQDGIRANKRSERFGGRCQLGRRRYRGVY